MVHIPIDLLAALDQRAFVASVNFCHNNCFEPSAARTDLGFRTTIPIAEGAHRVWETLVAEGKLQNSDERHQDDRILAVWEAVTAQMRNTLSA